MGRDRRRHRVGERSSGGGCRPLFSDDVATVFLARSFMTGKGAGSPFPVIDIPVVHTIVSGVDGHRITVRWGLVNGGGLASSPG